MPKKIRVDLPVELSAKVLFESDRTCCVCRQRKPVQIHHIDDDPANNDFTNLAVLCLDCHRETQIRGGFDRKLDAEQVRLYRADWLEKVRRYRVAGVPEPISASDNSDVDVRRIVAELEIYRTDQAWYDVARIYDDIGDIEMRDKYIELARKQDSSPFYEYLYARLQGRTHELSTETIDAVVEEVRADWTTHGRVLQNVGRTAEAAEVFLTGILEAIRTGEWFLAAFYMRHELNSNVVDSLFEMALRESVQEGNLWWQVRAFEELGWQDSKRELLLGNEKAILGSSELLLIRALAVAKRDDELLLRVTKEMSEMGPLAYMVDREESEDVEAEPRNYKDKN